jgi:hypothetical protein
MPTIPSKKETITSNGKIRTTIKHQKVSSSKIITTHSKVIKTNRKCNNKGSKTKTKATQTNNKDHNTYIQT